MATTTPTATTEVPAKTVAPALWSPLALPLFRMLWIALLTENICSWLLDVTNGWLMTSLSSSPVMVSLVQTAALLPILFFALPSGALTDILNRRSILMWTEASLCLVSAILAALVYLKVLTGPLLLVLIFINGTGLAFSMPVWQTALGANSVQIWIAIPEPHRLKVVHVNVDAPAALREDGQEHLGTGSQCRLQALEFLLQMPERPRG